MQSENTVETENNIFNLAWYGLLCIILLNIKTKETKSITIYLKEITGSHNRHLNIRLLSNVVFTEMSHLGSETSGHFCGHEHILLLFS